jgi:hypothetical protein
MTTNIQILTPALRALGIVGEVQAPSDEQGAAALAHLNRLLESWAAEDMAFGYFAQTDTTAVCPIPAWAERGVISKLAQALLQDYPSAQLAPTLLDDSQNGYAVIQRICLAQKLQPLNMRHLGGGQGGTYNILTDTR